MLCCRNFMDASRNWEPGVGGWGLRAEGWGVWINIIALHLKYYNGKNGLSKDCTYDDMLFYSLS